MTSAELERKACSLQAVIEEKTVQAHGMVPMFVRATDYQLPTAEDYAGAYRHRHLGGKTEAEIGIPPMHVWRAWENTSTDTAYYLGATAYQYRCTGDPAALQICRRTLGALKYIHGLGVERGERGFLCKPYGGVYSNQSSGDQVQCVLTGLAAYRPIAPPEDRADVDLLLRDFAQHAIDNGYVSPHGYFARDRQTLADRMFGSNWENVGWSYAIIYVPLLCLAWQATGHTHFLDQIEWWYTTCDLDWRAAAPGDVMSGFGHGWRDLYLPSLLMDLDPEHHELWRSMMRRRFGTSRTGILDNGTSALEWTWDNSRGERREQPAGFWSAAGGGRAQTGRSSILAMGCVMAQRWLPDEEMVPVARHILERLEPADMRFIAPVPPETAPASWQIETDLLDHDALTGWLRAYWEGRWRGYW